MSSLYGRLGLIASMALVVYTLITLALFRLIPVTLTLAGIAGFILSIGIAVDANILIFERMKEEMRRGRSHETAIRIGFDRAWSSIRDSNIASLITSSILYYFGTGIVRGFALTLALGVLVSMFSAITVTRTFLRVFYKD
jgi:preprotein translocase subunit SecD